MTKCPCSLPLEAHLQQLSSTSEKVIGCNSRDGAASGRLWRAGTQRDGTGVGTSPTQCFDVDCSRCASKDGLRPPKSCS